MPTWGIGDCLHGFRVERKDILPHLNAHYWKLTHEKNRCCSVLLRPR